MADKYVMVTLIECRTDVFNIQQFYIHSFIVMMFKVAFVKFIGLAR